ncbi:hypothetical protein [Paraburkholderia sp. SIMBA_054]|uniref:hypothetical protein n=1 Tax=Paraburkholderia sp. SIMBA_054 TaxID=3085795 RepID=UPI00397B533A
MIDTQSKARKSRIAGATVASALYYPPEHRLERKVQEIDVFFAMPRPTYHKSGRRHTPPFPSAARGAQTETLPGSVAFPPIPPAAPTSVRPAESALPTAAAPRKTISLRSKSGDGGAELAGWRAPGASSTSTVSTGDPDHDDSEPDDLNGRFRPSQAFYDRVPGAPVEQYISYADEIDSFFRWYTSLPQDFVESMDPESRRRLGNLFGAQYARTKSNPLKMKGADISLRIVAAQGKSVQRVKIYSRQMRRWFTRNFYYTQVAIAKRRAQKDGNRISQDYLTEARARVRELRDKLDCDVKSGLENRAYFEAEVAVTGDLPSQVIEVVLEFDAFLALAKPVDRRETDYWTSYIFEVLNWLKAAPETKAWPRYAPLTSSPFIPNTGKRVPQLAEEDA